jgi:serine/threonine protein kinase
MWKRLKHESIVPFIGVYRTEDHPFCMVSEWMPQDNIRKYVLKNAGTNRLRLVSFIIPANFLTDIQCS